MNDPSPDIRPPLVLVGGAPGAGKTTLASALAPCLGLPLLRKDALKETLFDALREAGSPEAVSEREASKRLGWAAICLLYAQALNLLAAGCGCIVESNFYRGVSERDLAPLLAMSDARLTTVRRRTACCWSATRRATRPASATRPTPMARRSAISGVH